MLPKILFMVGGFFCGVLMSFVGVSTFVRLTYACTPAELPCDTGATTGIGLFFLLVPLLTPLFTWLGRRVYLRHIAPQV